MILPISTRGIIEMLTPATMSHSTAEIEISPKMFAKNGIK